MIGKKNSFTLIEIVIAMSIFSIVSLAIVGAFADIVSIQRKVLGMQDVQNNARLLIESLSRELRMAVIDGSGTCAGMDNVFNIIGPSTIKFKNYKHECVEYKVLGSAIRKTAMDNIGNVIYSADVTGSDIEVGLLNFYIRDNRPAGEQPFVTISVILKKSGTSDEFRTIRIQTSLSARAYE